MSAGPAACPPSELELLPSHSRPFGRSAWHPETGRFGDSQQSRSSISDGPFRENAIGNRFWENGPTRRHWKTNPAAAVPLSLPYRISL